MYRFSFRDRVRVKVKDTVRIKDKVRLKVMASLSVWIGKFAISPVQIILSRCI